MRTLLTRSGPRMRRAVFAVPRPRSTQPVRERIQRQQQEDPATAAAPLATGTLKSGGFANWHYVAYLDQKTILLARDVSSTSPARRIGTIPWITRNPGNITVSTDPKAGEGAREAFRRGAYGKGGGRQHDKATKRYAIFPDVGTGLAAIWPQLQLFNKRNGGKLTLLAAMKIFKGVDPGETADVKEGYVAAITEFLTDIVLEHGDTEAGADRGEDEVRRQARKDAGAILATPMSRLDPDDVEYQVAREALVTKEGGLNPPGVSYHCEDGFAANNKSRYGASQWKAIEALKGSSDVLSEIRAVLGCP